MKSLYVYTVQIRLVDIIKNSENNKKFYINYSFEDKYMDFKVSLKHAKCLDLFL